MMMMMMMMTTAPSLNTNSYTQQYADEQIKTASKEQLLIMLFDGAIKFLRIAKKAMIAKDYEKSHNHLIKAQKIIAEFMVSLDVEQGGETAEGLLQLYEFYYHSLIKANLKKDVALIQEITEQLVDMRKMWNEAIQIAATERKQALMLSVAANNQEAVVRQA
jgi:flagellar secretion chaperone FliS